MPINRSKVVIIGAGFVGSTLAYTLIHSGVASELVLIDINKEKAQGEVADLNHGLSFVAPVKVKVGDYEECKDAKIVVITAGPSIEPGETRLDLAKKNAKLTKEIVQNIIKYTKDAILLIVTNPVDILTYVAAKVSGLPPHQVIGSGTVLDSARFRYLLSEHCEVDVRNVHGYILGEHGDSEVPIWSLTNIAGMTIDNYCKVCRKCSKEHRDEIFEKVKNAAYYIIERKGATYYGVALAVRRIIEAILRNENSVLTVSSVLEGQHGLDDVALSLPSIVGENGIRQVIELPLTEDELEKLKASADKLKEVIKDLTI
ncbi:L-lactate dehydrogenase [Anoxybacter fermentans]|uniref:L-lactate dehydrogenase n=1 Tax=Anoxybacter fermentans TaxID=1323375 RepID=A0A3S9T1P9_9FIRM|nr:L-lactate dehydrogenase [Anoxybacter fermentans]AZR74536.1 L-lactate dehydrogenase [Anoxybacter fermentans]